MQTLLDCRNGIQGFGMFSSAGRRKSCTLNTPAFYPLLIGRESARRPFAICKASQLLELERLQTVSVGGILAQDLVAFGVSLIGSLVWVKFLSLFSDRNLIERVCAVTKASTKNVL